MIRYRRRLNESLLEPASRDELSADPMTNGEGPLLYEDDPYNYVSIWVCGSRNPRFPGTNEVWVSCSDPEAHGYSEPAEFVLYGLNPMKAKMIGNVLANIHRNQGEEALIKKAKELGFWQN